MNVERFNKMLSNDAMFAREVFSLAMDGSWPYSLSEEFVLVEDQEFGDIFALTEAELHDGNHNGLYTIVRSDGTKECVAVGRSI